MNTVPDDYRFQVLYTRTHPSDLAKEFGLDFRKTAGFDVGIVSGFLDSIDAVRRFTYESVGHLFFLRNRKLYGPRISMYDGVRTINGELGHFKTGCSIVLGLYTDTISKEANVEIRRAIINRSLTDSVSRIL